MHYTHVFAAAAALFASGAIAAPKSAVPKSTSTSKSAPSPTASPAPKFYYSPDPNYKDVGYYVKINTCSMPQSPTDPKAFKNPDCQPRYAYTSTSVPTNERDIGSLQGMTLLRSLYVLGFNKAFSFEDMNGNPLTMDCFICGWANCMADGGAVSFRGTLYDTTDVEILQGSKVQESYGNYLLCAVAGQPLNSLVDPVSGGINDSGQTANGYVMPGEWVANEGYYAHHIPTPIPTSLGNQIPLKTPPPSK